MTVSINPGGHTEDLAPIYLIKTDRASIVVSRDELYEIGAAAQRAAERDAEFWRQAYREEHARNKERGA